jgi:hypothetical protein
MSGDIRRGGDGHLVRPVIQGKVRREAKWFGEGGNNADDGPGEHFTLSSRCRHFIFSLR